MMLRVILISLSLAIAGSTGARAATETFPTSVFTSFGVANPNNLLGNTPATTTFNAGSGAVFVFDDPITNHSTIINVTAVNPALTYIWFRFGQVTGGAFQNATGVGLTAPNGAPSANAYILLSGPGAVTIPPTAFTDSCRAIGGCNAVVFGASTFSDPGGGFTASALISSAPEPAAWALMIFGFCGVAWRMKAIRANIVARASHAAFGAASKQAAH